MLERLKEQAGKLVERLRPSTTVAALAPLQPPHAKQTPLNDTAKMFYGRTADLRFNLGIYFDDVRRGKYPDATNSIELIFHSQPIPKEERSQHGNADTIRLVARSENVRNFALHCEHVLEGSVLKTQHIDLRSNAFDNLGLSSDRAVELFRAAASAMPGFDECARTIKDDEQATASAHERIFPQE